MTLLTWMRSFFFSLWGYGIVILRSENSIIENNFFSASRFSFKRTWGQSNNFCLKWSFFITKQTEMNKNYKSLHVTYNYVQLACFVCLFLCMTSLTSKCSLTLSWRRPLLYRNQSIDLLYKSIDWFLYGNGLHHERVKSSVRKKLFRRKRNLSIVKSQPSAHIPLPIRKFSNSSSLELYKLNNWLWKNQWI